MKDEPMKATRYRELRKEYLGDQASAAEILGASRETIGRRENGKQEITREASLALLAAAYERGLPVPSPEASGASGA